MIGAMILEQIQQKADCKHSEKLLVFPMLVLLMKSQFLFIKSESSHIINWERVHTATLQLKNEEINAVLPAL